MSGTYAINTSGGDYGTFYDAISDLKCRGVGGAVVFNVDAEEFDESVDIPAIPGASSTNTIIFQGAGRGNSIISSDGSGPRSSLTVKYDNCSYVTFSGFSIKYFNNYQGGGLQPPRRGIYTSVRLNQAQYCYLLNCDISADGFGNWGIYISNSSFSTVQNCHVSSTRIGIDVEDTWDQGTGTGSNISLINNRIVNESGIRSYGTSQNIYSNNIIDSCIGYSYLYYDNGLTLNNNQFLSNGLYVYDPNYSSSSAPTNIYNNFVLDPEDIAGQLTIDNNQSNVFFGNNTLYSGQDGQGFIYTNNSSSGTGINVVDNIFYGGNASTAAATFYFSNSPSNMVDGNDYFNPGGSGSYLLDVNDASYYSSLSDVQAALSSFSYSSPYTSTNSVFEAAATNVLPSYTNLTETATTPVDLHFASGAAAIPGLYAGISSDIYGATRSTTTPTAGAVESPCTSPSVSSSPSSSTVCTGSSTSFSVSATGTSLTYQWQENQGSAWANLTDDGVTYSNSATATLTLTGVITSMNGYQYQCVVSGTCSPAATSGSALLTVNAPMSGTYAIDPSGSGDYTTFTDAIADLDCRGVNGAIVFNVAPGTYTEAISVDAIPGVSATNTITFNGGGYSNVTLTDAIDLEVLAEQAAVAYEAAISAYKVAASTAAAANATADAAAAQASAADATAAASAANAAAAASSAPGSTAAAAAAAQASADANTASADDAAAASAAAAAASADAAVKSAAIALNNAKAAYAKALAAAKGASGGGKKKHAAAAAATKSAAAAGPPSPTPASPPTKGNGGNGGNAVITVSGSNVSFSGMTVTTTSGIDAIDFVGATGSSVNYCFINASSASYVVYVDGG